MSPLTLEAVFAPLNAPLAALASLFGEKAQPSSLLPAVSSARLAEVLRAEIAARLSDAEVEALRKYDVAARDCLGSLSDGAVEALCAACAQASDDVEGDTRDTIEDCVEEDSAQLAAAVSPEMIQAMFAQFDPEGHGVVSHQQFKEALLELGLGHQFSDEELDVLVQVADKDNDGSINFEDFTKWLYAGGGKLVAQASASICVNAEDHQGVTDGDDLKRVEASLRQQLCRFRKDNEVLEAKLSSAERVSSQKIKRIERDFEADTEGDNQFWKAIVKSSASSRLNEFVDVSTSEVLGNGNYGFVLKCRRQPGHAHDERPVVVKLLSSRWSQLAAKEWKYAQSIADHPSVLGCLDDAVMHLDADRRIEKLLKEAQDSGRIRLKSKRVAFPDRFICIFQEYMNRGTLQSWMEMGQLRLGSVLVVMQRVAAALTHLHRNGLCHNDVKPANIFLRQDDESHPQAEMIIKLGDLGLTTRSMDRSVDLNLYGMTSFCILTGEVFGTRKFQPPLADELVGEATALIQEARMGARTVATLRVLKALSDLPSILTELWHGKFTMAEVERHPALQGWSFFDGDPDCDH